MSGGDCFGPRHIVPSLILLFIPIVFLPLRWLKQPIFWLLGLISYFYSLIATSVLLVMIDTSQRPFWGYLFPMFKKGILAVNKYMPLDYYNYFGIIKFSTWNAFNLGMLLKLPGFYSLLPLIIFQAMILGMAWKLRVKV